jgi:glycosyltransferase involved in cell wall biosynthesis
MANRVPRSLIIGPLPPPIGGTRVSFQHLVEFLSARSDFLISVLQIWPLRRSLLRSLFSSIGLLARVVSKLPETNVVSLHCNPDALWLIGVPIALLAKAARKPFMVRTFGGLPFLHEYRGIRLALTRWILKRADLYLAQTKEQVVMARTHGVEVRWFPTSRPKREQFQSHEDRSCTRFIFCSHIKPSKGIFELIDAVENLGKDVVVDVYGPFRDGLGEDVFRTCRIVKYCGVLSPEQVAPTLERYDALLFPTYFEGEGYPGIIIEAYQAGIPVITTRWRSVPDIVHERSGILVPPKDAVALSQAIRSLVDDKVRWQYLKAGAIENGERYALEFWGQRFVEFCAALASGKAVPDDPR